MNKKKFIQFIKVVTRCNYHTPEEFEGMLYTLKFVDGGDDIAFIVKNLVEVRAKNSHLFYAFLKEAKKAASKKEAVMFLKKNIDFVRRLNAQM